MKYTLKNKKKLDLLMQLSADFEKALNEAVNAEPRNTAYFIEFGPNAKDGDQSSYVAFIDADEIAEVYNPREWNAWPDVTPPAGIRMRVELSDYTGIRAEFGLHGRWLSDSGVDLEVGDVRVVRFRPWEG